MPARRSGAATNPRSTPYTRTGRANPASSGTLVQESPSQLSHDLTDTITQGTIHDADETESSFTATRLPSDQMQLEPRLMSITQSGDVILAVGCDGRRIQVSSHMLSAASRTFEEALRYAIKVEAAENAQITKQLDLPDDDVEAMVVVCNILHLRSDLVPAVLEPAKILTIARLVHKYSLQKAVYLAAGYWLKYDENKLDMQGIGKLLVAAELMNHVTGYAAICGKLLLYGKEQYYTLIQSFHDDHLFAVAFFLEQRRQGRREALADILTHPLIASCSTPGCARHPNPDCTCSFGQDIRQAMRSFAHDKDIDAKFFFSSSVNAITRKLRGVKEAPSNQRELYDQCPSQHPKRFHVYLDGMIDKLRSSLPVPCLYCTRARKETKHTRDEPCTNNSSTIVDSP